MRLPEAISQLELTTRADGDRSAVNQHHQNDGPDCRDYQLTRQSILMDIEELEIGDDPVGANCRQYPKQQIAQDAESATLNDPTYQSGYDSAHDNLQMLNR